MDLQITSIIGDTPVRTIPMVVDVDNDLTPFFPASAWGLTLSGKLSLNDDDARSQFQIMGGAGITVAGSDALCQLARPATVDLRPANLYFDIRATHLVTGETHIVARGRWRLILPSTRLSSPSMVVYTVNPFPGYVGGGEQDSFGTAENINGGIDLTLYNYTTGQYRRLIIEGSGPSERLAFYDV